MSEENINEFKFDNICYSSVNSKNERKQILQDISGYAYSGEVFAVLGPSGAGKTSLLSVLSLNCSGKNMIIEGRCALNGQQLNKTMFQDYFYLVPQDDSHRAFITCRETLRFAADFYINDNDEVKDKVVEDLLVKLGLENCKNTRVGNQFLQGLSGGQKKRLSIGLALLKKPAVLFLDEPTSGLDSAASFHCMNYIRDLAKAYNIIVIATIHQPSSHIYSSFHKVLLLSTGRTAYFGTPKGSCKYFDTVLKLPIPHLSNPAEFVIDAINSEFTEVEKVSLILDTWNDQKETYISYITSESLPSKPTELSKLLQLYYVFKRQIYIILKDPMVYSGRALMYLIMCVFFAVVYVHSRVRDQNQIFDRLWILIWFMGTPTSLGVVAVYAFNEEYKTILKETKNGMFSIYSYVLSAFILQLPAMFVLALFSVGIPGFVIIDFYAPNFLTIICLYACIYSSFESIARLFSVAFDNSLLGMLSYLNCWFTSFLFAGIVIPEDHVIWPFRVFFFIFPLKWGIPGIAFLDAIDANYNGAYLCEDVSRTDCLFHYNSHNEPIMPGWTCTTTPNGLYNKLGCYGMTGQQVLESLKINFGAISSSNLLDQQFGIVIAIGVFFHLLSAIFTVQKASRFSTIVDTSVAAKSKFYLNFKSGSQTTLPSSSTDNLESGIQ